MKTLISFLILLFNLNIFLKKPKDINLYFIRHAKGYHNQAAINFGFHQYENHEWFDAALTDEGISQAKELYHKIKNIKPDLIYSSPFIRTIETLNYSLNNNFIKVPILLDDNIRETINGHPCNYRHNKEFIINYTKSMNRIFNYDNIIDLYRFNENIPDDIIIRGNKWFLNMLLFIKNKPDIKNIIIFTHGSFIKFLLNSYHFRKLNTNKNCKRYPSNVEICPIIIKGN